MHRYLNCIAHNSSDGNLLIGDTHTALFDCGMAFCADETIERTKNALNGKSLDYIFLSHTHYDHIGAIPFFRKEWPQVQIVTSEIGAAVLLKDTPRRVIRELSLIAAGEYGICRNMEYDDNDFRADVIVKDGDIVQLGSVSVEVLETPGHTRDSICFFIPELELLILNETPGVLLPDGFIYPGFLSCYEDAINSIQKCGCVNYKFLSLPHRGITGEDEIKDFFIRALNNTKSCHDFIVSMVKKKLDEIEMMKLFYEKYGNTVTTGFQPEDAFFANAKAMIGCMMRDLTPKTK